MQITSDDPDHNGTDTYCGTDVDVPKTLTFAATFVKLTFTTDHSEKRSGFKITYKLVRKRGKQLKFLPYRNVVHFYVTLIMIIIVILFIKTFQFIKQFINSSMNHRPKTAKIISRLNCDVYKL